MKNLLFIFPALAVGAAAGLTFTPCAAAANVTWNLAGGGNWDTTSNNWIGGSPNPNRFVTNDNATFDNSAGGTINLVGSIDPGSVTVNAASGTYTFAGGAMVNAFNIQKDGAGTLVLQNSNAIATGLFGHLGSLSGNAGLLRIDAGGSVSTNSQIFAQNGGTLHVNGGSLSSSLAATNTFGIRGGGVFQLSSGAVTVSGNNAAVRVVIGGFTASSEGTGTWTQTGGSFSMPNGASFWLGNQTGATMTVSGGTISMPNASFNVGIRGTSTATISGTAVVTVGTTVIGHQSTGTGTLFLGSGGAFTGGANVHVGGTSGMLLANTVERGDGVGRLEFHGGTLRARQAATLLNANLTSATIRAGGGAIDNNTFNVAIAEPLLTGAANDGGMAFLGSGVTTLTAANTYNGQTTVRSGTLALAHASNNNLANSKVIQINSGATLDVTGLTGAADLILAANQRLQGTGTIVGNVTISANSTLAPGNRPGAITFNHNLTLAPSAFYAFEDGDLTSVLGQLTLGNASLANWTLQLGAGFLDGGSIVLFDYGSLAVNFDLTPTFDLSKMDFVPTGPLSLVNDVARKQILLLGVQTAIPEPSSFVLLAGAALAATLYGIRRRC